MDSEERREEPAKECVHKTKLVQFLGRTTPIILQNDNGPCPLLAICNVLLLRNNLNLNPDITEVSQEKLLSLVAERLIDSNSNVNNKDTGYVENQQQNIADAIDLLPLLATGIDVNIKFRRIDDFEFTRECAIFDLLDIPLYHGWIVDPQDHDTAEAVGSMSYNALMGKLVALETQNVKEESKSKPEEDAIDFAAATTATLGVPSPCLPRGRSFDESPRSDSNDKKFRKGDVEEEAELLRVLQLSEAELPTSVDDSPIADTFEDNALDCTDGNACRKKFVPLDPVDTVEGMTGNEIETSQQQPIPVCTDGIACHEKFVPLDSIGTIEGMTGNEIETCLQQPISCPLDDHSDSGNGVNDPKSHETTSNTPICSSSLTSDRNPMDQLTKESAEVPLCNHVVEGEKINTFQNGEVHSMLPGGDMECVTESHKDTVGGEEHVGTQSLSTVDTSELSNSQGAFGKTGWSSFCGPDAGSDSSSVSGQHVEVPEAISPSVNGSEPIYEGEECILDSGAAICEDREPVYEGEAVLAEQVDKSSIDATSLSLKDEITPREGELIRNFLRSSASQLTIYGLFCLQDGLKERELCVFFRNNHFNTMFKIDGELYILATDQGYISQPDLVWEKLNEVNGDTIFMTGNFKEFKVEGNADGKWDEHNAMTSTSDYLASIDHSAQEVDSNFNSDLQLAIALQQQEFEQQKQPQRPVQQPSTTGSSRLVTGPQVSKSSGRSSSSSTPTKHDTKSKEKCIVM